MPRVDPKADHVVILMHAYEAMRAVPDALRALDQPAEFRAVTSRARDALAATLTVIGAAPTDHGTFDLADRDLKEGDVFRWPVAAGPGVATRLTDDALSTSRWRITLILNPRVDEITQRVQAERVR